MFVHTSGMCLLTSIMTPKYNQVRAVVCFCHGYLGSSSLLARCEYQRFVVAGIAVVTLEYEGHGRSDGRLGLIPSWEKMIDDTSKFFEEICAKKISGLPCFLNGEVCLMNIYVIFFHFTLQAPSYRLFVPL